MPVGESIHLLLSSLWLGKRAGDPVATRNRGGGHTLIIRDLLKEKGEKA